MDVRGCNDENATDERSKIVRASLLRNTPTKTPLKPLNDACRLSSSPVVVKSVEDMKTPRTSPYMYIRQLDSAERWIERTSVVTKQDHLDNLQSAESILQDLVHSLPLSTDNTWIGNALLETRKCEEETESQCVPISHLDELADMLYGLDIGHNTQTPNMHRPISKITGKTLKEPLPERTVTNILLINKQSKDLDKVYISEPCQKVEVNLCKDTSLDSKDKVLCLDIDQPLKLAVENSNVDLSKQKAANQEKCFQISKMECSNESADPFKSSVRLSDTPVCEERIDVLSNNNNSALDTHVLIPSNQMRNSFAAESGKTLRNEAVDSWVNDNPVKSKVELVHPPTAKSVKDPFRSNIQLMNSPVVESVKDPFKSNIQLMNSTVAESVKDTVEDNLVDPDPFKSKIQMVNSPATESVKNPFKSNIQLMNSPAAENVHDPFKSKIQLVNSTVAESVKDTIEDNLVDVDYFKSKIQLKDSPATKRVKDPFKSKTQLMNSHVAESVKAVRNEQEDLVIDAEPFKSKIQLMNSPVAESVKDTIKDNLVDTDHFKTEIQLMKSDTESVKEPFKSNLQLMNSAGAESAKAVRDPIEDNLVDADPFKTEIQLINSPDTESVNDPFKSKIQLINSPVAESVKDTIKDNLVDTDPFKTEIQLMKSDTESVKEPFKSNLQLMNSAGAESAKAVRDPIEDNLVDADPFKTEIQLINSPDTESVNDPFKSKIQLINSPVAESVKDPFKSNTQLMNSPAAESESYLFKSNIQLINSPAAESESDPFKSNLQLMNSPAAESAKAVRDPIEDNLVNADPFKTEIQLMKSDTESVKEPFKSNIQLMNSAGAESAKAVRDPIEDNLVDADPFKTEIQLINSPDTESVKDPFKSKIQLVNSSVAESVKDPFKSNTQLMNSPAAESESYLFKSNIQLINSPAAESESDPFKSNLQLMNSPAAESAKAVRDPIEDNLAHSDPFKTEIQLINSLDTESVKDPFKSKIQLMNSPAGENVKAVTNKQADSLSDLSLAASAIVQQADQMNTGGDKEASETSTVGPPSSSESTKRYLDSNNPVLSDKELSSKFRSEADKFANTDHTAVHHNNGVDSFSSSSQSPAFPEESSKHNNTHPVSSTLHTANTTGRLTKEAVSKQQGLEASIKMTKANVEEYHNKKELSSHEIAVSKHFSDLGLPVKVNCSCGDAITNGQPSSKNDSDASMMASNEEKISFSENEFIPATQAFNDPSFFDMLEKSSSSCTLNPKRGSVLMKFDPLQEQKDHSFIKPASPGPMKRPSRISDVFNMSKNAASFLCEDSICLLGTPPRVARRRTLTRKVHNARALSIEEEAGASEVDAIFGLDDDGIGMDTILYDNLVAPSSSGAKLVDVAEFAVYTERDAQQIRAELTMHYQELLLRKDKECQERISKQEETAKKEYNELMAESDTQKAKIKTLQGKLNGVKDVIKEYTDIISQVVAENESMKTKLAESQTQNSQLLEDNKVLEKSFNDLFHRYEKVKTTLEKAAENETVLKHAITEVQEKYKSCKETTKKIKEMAESKIAELEEKYEKVCASTKDEAMRQEAALKRKDMQIKGLETNLEQKTKENKELNDLVDSFIKKGS